MSTVKIINELRFIERGGKRILQQQPATIRLIKVRDRDMIQDEIEIKAGEWEDVPMIIPQIDRQLVQQEK